MEFDVLLPCRAGMFSLMHFLMYGTYGGVTNSTALVYCLHPGYLDVQTAGIIQEPRALRFD